MNAVKTNFTTSEKEMETNDGRCIETTNLGSYKKAEVKNGCKFATTESFGILIKLYTSCCQVASTRWSTLSTIYALKQLDGAGSKIS